MTPLEEMVNRFMGVDQRRVFFAELSRSTQRMREALDELVKACTELNKQERRYRFQHGPERRNPKIEP